MLFERSKTMFDDEVTLKHDIELNIFPKVVLMANTGWVSLLIQHGWSPMHM